MMKTPGGRKGERRILIAESWAGSQCSEVLFARRGMNFPEE